MAANDEGDENNPRGTEWEVVSLTASTYAAAPGPKDVEFKDDDSKDNAYGVGEAETSRALFMSGHFVFPPNQHENLPLEPDKSEITDEHVGKTEASEPSVGEGAKSSGKGEENWTLKGLSVTEDFPEIQIFDEKGNKFAMSGKNFEESTTLDEFNLEGKQQSIYSTSNFSSFHSETGLGGSTTYAENLGVAEVINPPEEELELTPGVSLSPKSAKDDKYNDESNLPCEAWWKRRAASLYAHAKEANTFWSIFIAAAVMGIVILGQRWQQERWQVLQLKWQASINSEKSGRLLGPISRLKDVFVGGNRRGSYIRGTTLNES